MRNLLLLSLLPLAQSSEAQWTRDEGLPDTIPSILTHGDGLYVGGVGTAYHRTGPDEPWQTWATLPDASVYVDALAHFEGGLFAGTGGAAMFRSEDPAAAWAVSPGISGLGSHQISCITTFEGALYCGTVGGGTFRLSNGTWQQFGVLGDDQANNVYFLRAIGDTLWCGAGGNGYLFHLSAGDTDWTPIPVDVVTGLSIEFTDLIAVPGALVAGGTMGTYRSTDHGASWTWTAGPAAIVKFTWWNDVLIASRTGATTRWFRSDNGGLAWNVFSETPLCFGHAVYDDRFYAGRLDGLWYMENLPTAVVDHAPAPFELFPNPAHDHITVRTADAYPLRFEVRDIQGRTVLSGAGAGPTRTIDVQDLPRGAYVLQLHGEGRSAATRFMLQ